MTCTFLSFPLLYIILQMIQISCVLANRDLELLYDWLCANRLSINTGKTEFIVFRPRRHNLGV